VIFGIVGPVAALRRSWTPLVLSAAVPAAMAGAWVPVRDHLPNTDLALVLVLVIGSVGWMAGWVATIGSSLAAGIAFDVLDTRPYGTLAIARGSDLLTALLLVITGALVGTGAARLARYRHSEESRADALAVVMEASGLVATGQERRLVAEALSAELQRELQLAECTFRPEPPTGARPTVARDGSLVGLIAGTRTGGPTVIDLPVWSQGDVVGHYQLVLGRTAPSKHELRIALSLADQAGAAMAGYHPDPPSPSGPGRRLRLIGPRAKADPESESAPAPTSSSTLLRTG
jgi:hypothetical protein